MSNKNLLNESQIRQFMKLAKLQPLTPGFVEGLQESHGRGIGENPPHARLEEADEEADLDATEDELGRMDADVDDKDEEIDDLEDELDAAEDADADEGRMIAVDDFLAALEDALERAMGEEVEISDESGDEDEVEGAVVMDAEMDMDGEDVDMDIDAEEMLEETGAKRTGASAHDKGKDKEDPEDRDYSGHGMRKRDKSDTDPGEEDFTTKKGMKKKTGPGDAYEDDKKKKNESTEATDELVEQITKRVAARILKSALAKK